MKEKLISLFKSIKPTYLLGFALHFAFLAAIYWLYHGLGWFDRFPNDVTLSNWDGYWFENIVNVGYKFNADRASNTGFFPLFPAIWKLLTVNAGFMSFYNLLMALGCMYVLAQEYKWSVTRTLTYLALPSLFFLYVPYSESIYFVCCTLILIGLTRSKQPYIYIGLFVAGLTRPTLVFFIPALFAVDFYKWFTHQENFITSLKRVSLVVFSSVSATVISYLVHWYQTGVWMAHYKTVSTYWGRILRVPVFPLHTYGMSKILWLDAWATILCVFAIVYLLYLLRKSLPRVKSPIEFDANTIVLLFTATYLLMAFCSVFFYRDNYFGTNMRGINRYVFVTPFLLQSIHIILENGYLKRKMVLSLLAVLTMVALMYGVWRHENHFYHFSALMALLTIGIYGLGKNETKWSWIPVYVIFCCAQTYLFNMFIAGIWVA